MVEGGDSVAQHIAELANCARDNVARDL